MCGDIPQGRAGAPQTRVDAPQVCADAPQTCVDAPQVCADAPQTRVDASQVRAGLRRTCVDARSTFLGRGVGSSPLSLFSLLFAVVRIQWFGAQDAAVRTADEPFVAVGVVDGFADGVVGDDVEDEVAVAVVDELMG